MTDTLTAAEEARLAALSAFDVLDTAPEEEYDDLTRLAARAAAAPVSAISLVDRHRLWFKARVGLDIPETPRDHTFCAAVVADRETLVVSDATADGRFAATPLVAGDAAFRFYAGVPLHTRDGQVLGTLCVIDRRPRALDPAARDTLEALARQVSRLLELRRVNAQLAAALAGVERLRSLLPVCAWCRKLRDDAGYWHSVEAYLKQEAGVSVTHGICPGCVVKVTAG